MPEAGAAAAQAYRERMRSKAERLGGGEDASNPGVDASEFTPGEPLDADAKTGMRPVSRQARKRGGSVKGEQSPLGAHALARPGRKARKAGGRVGRQEGGSNYPPGLKKDVEPGPYASHE